MTQVVLSRVGGALGGPLGGLVGGLIGRTVDQALVSGLTPPREGPRLSGFRLQSTAEGTPLALAYGRVRLAGQVIWAARFTERGQTSGGKGGPRTRDYDYALSFAVGLCEGPIDGIGRVWADGEPLDLSGVTLRLHHGRDDQMPDPLIEAIEAEGAVPAYRGLAYVVFEDLPLGGFGNRLPQLSFEVFRRPEGAADTLEERLEGVCLIPGAGEFAYATTPVLRRESLVRTRAENVNNAEGRADLVVAVDRLLAQAPNLKRVTLVVAWFGDDLRAGHCRVRPAVDARDKATLPLDWSVSGLRRPDAREVSRIDGAPAYGGTPDDASVLQAIAHLKMRGLEVTLLPFLMMDIPAGNGRPDPQGGESQPAYPWRGRITCDPAPGRPGSPDRTAAAAQQVEAFFGLAQPDDFAVVEGAVAYVGPEDWSWRRMVLHYAWLGRLAGVDGLVIGSEFRGLTSVRDGPSSYPAVEALRQLAQDCRAVLGPDVGLTYAADWSEWSSHAPADGSGDLHFHLDPLWADPAISHVGIDWYPPLTDARDGIEDDPAAGVAGGEAFDWFYADPAAREAGVRSPIVDGAYGEDWVYRAKDIRGWWSNPHHNRPGGEREATPTAWTPGLKPIRFVEFGCPAVHRGANAPNLFIDAKSSESGLPPFSSGGRDDAEQRRALEAVLNHFADPDRNPPAPDGRRMVEAMDAWCWDARPFPDFPARPEVWADAANWRRGHWLSGRLVGSAAGLIRALVKRAGVEGSALDLSGVTGAVDGLLLDGPSSARSALAPVLAVLGGRWVERGGRMAVVTRPEAATALGSADLALPEDGSAIVAHRRLEPAAQTVTCRFIDAEADYATGAVSLRAETETGGPEVRLDLPVTLSATRAEAVAATVLAAETLTRQTVTVRLSPLALLRLEPGDTVTLPGQDGDWRVEGVDWDEQPSARLTRWVEPVAADGGEAWRVTPSQPPAGPPLALVFEAPPLPGSETDSRPLAVAACQPWQPVDLHMGADETSLALRSRLSGPGRIGQLAAPLAGGQPWRWLPGASLEVAMVNGLPDSPGEAAANAGAGRIAVLGSDGVEVLAYASAEPLSETVWRLEGLVRGLDGTEPEAALGHAVGALVVWLDEAVGRVDVGADERGLSRLWRAVPAGLPPGGLAAAEGRHTYSARALRPARPAHLTARRRLDGAVDLSWVRRARYGGDGWETEPPLTEPSELYRIEVRQAGLVIRAWEADRPGYLWTPEDQAQPPVSAPGEPLEFAVAQLSQGWGAGPFAVCTLAPGA